MIPRIREVRAFTIRGRGADYHDQDGAHWIDDRVSTPMAIYPEYRDSRRSFGINVLGTLIVEIEADNGLTGFALTTAGPPGAWIVENHLSQFLEGKPITEIERIWDQMYRATMYYGRRGLVLNVISAVDLALYDLLGRFRQEPVHALIGGRVRDEISFYATGPKPAAAKKLGFIGGKMPLRYGPPDGESGLRENLRALEGARNDVGDDFWLMLDAWMSLDLRYATNLSHQAAEFGLKWLEEPLSPDDYQGYAALVRSAPSTVRISTGEHEATRWGFRQLLDAGVDFIQPDVNWCGGMTELLKISALADSYNAIVVPHGSSVYSYHFLTARVNSPFGEFLMMHPTGEEVVPMFAPVLEHEPIPVGGRLRVPDLPGFGVELNPALQLERVTRRRVPGNRALHNSGCRCGLNPPASRSARAM